MSLKIKSLNLRKAVLSVVALVTVFVLTSCSGTYTDYKRDGGQTVAQAEDAIKRIPGVTSANFTTASWYSPGEGGFLSDRGMNLILDITVQPDYHIVNPEAFLDMAVREAWSVNDKYPKGTVKILIQGGVDNNYDWSKETIELFNTVYSTKDYNNVYQKFPTYALNKSIIIIPTANVAKALGSWPSEPYKAPSAITAAGAPQVLKPVGIVNADFSWVEAGEYCYNFHADRNKSSDGTYYDGVVTGNLIIDGEVIRTETEAPVKVNQDFSGLNFCYQNKSQPTGKDIKISVEAPATEKFQSYKQTLNFRSN